MMASLMMKIMTAMPMMMMMTNAVQTRPAPLKSAPSEGRASAIDRYAKSQYKGQSFKKGRRKEPSLSHFYS